jgi:hypothetical protein
MEDDLKEQFSEFGLLSYHSCTVSHLVFSRFLRLPISARATKTKHILCLIASYDSMYPPALDKTVLDEIEYKSVKVKSVEN